VTSACNPTGTDGNHPSRACPSTRVSVSMRDEILTPLGANGQQWMLEEVAASRRAPQIRFDPRRTSS
jgi:hypothetical protein